MQIGGRWPFGASAPRAVPDALREEIARVEAETPAEARTGSWTLTWLEGRPVAELDDGRRVTEAGTASGANDENADDDGDEDDEDLFPLS